VNKNKQKKRTEKTGVQKNAEARTWKQRLGSFGYRARLHGHELPSRSRPRQERNDSTDPQKELRIQITGVLLVRIFGQTIFGCDTQLSDVRRGTDLSRRVLDRN
jgi:hypothetical protein